MEQVRIFSLGHGDTQEQLEKDINLWLRLERPQIISRHMSVAAGINDLNKAYVNCTVAIFYDTEEL